MGAVPENIRLMAAAAAARLREHAAQPPDENLLSSIITSGAVGEEFAHAYAALRDLGLEDKALDRFGVENASAGEMREAADLLEQLASSTRVPGPRKRGHRIMSVSTVRKHRVGAMLVALVFSLAPIVFGGVALIRGLLALEDWRHGSGVVLGPATPPQPHRPVVERQTSKPSALVKPRDHVTDHAGVLSPVAARRLNDRLVQFERETTNQVLVYIGRRIPPNTTLEELGSTSIRHWGVGQNDKDNGVIFFVFIDDRKMRIEVGYGLEPALTDARSRRITSQIVKPLFQDERFAEGIEAGTQAIMDAARGGDVPAQVAASSASAPPQPSVWPMVFSFGVFAACVAFLIYIVRGLVLFFQGYPTALFRVRAFSWAGGGDGGSSSSDSYGGSDSSSSGSFSGGGGDGGGGGSSDSW